MDLRTREGSVMTTRRPATEEGIRVYSRDVLDELLEAEGSFNSSPRSQPERETSSPSVAQRNPSPKGGPAVATESGRAGRGGTPQGGDRSGMGSRGGMNSQGSEGFWQRGNMSPRLSASPSYSSMSARKQARVLVKKEEYARLNDEYERNQMVGDLKLPMIAEKTRRKKDADFNKIYTEMLSGMAENGVLDDVEQHLVRSEEAKAKKRMDLHDEWTDKVFDTIQDKIQTTVDSRDSQAIKERLRTQYNEYLKVTNEKVGVFRDTIIEQDYDPLKAREASIKYNTQNIEDPLKRDMLKVYKEKMALGLADMLQGGEICKDTFDTKWWDKTHATPYGYDVNEDGTIKEFREDPLAAKNKTSKVAFDHYGHPLGNEVPDIEWETCGPKCKSGFAPGPEQRRNRQDLFETFHQLSNPYHDGRTLGDQWLEHKGKANPPGPEMRRGRPDLFETFQMMSDPAEDGRALGDYWLERRGKANPPGPEQRRNRQNLFETFQMKTNPYEDGRSVGDHWLERKGKGFPFSADAEVKNTPKFDQTLSHTVREDYDEKRKRRVIPPPPGEIGTLMYHNARVGRDQPVNERHTRSQFTLAQEEY